MSILFGIDVASIQFRIVSSSAISKNVNNKICKNSLGELENSVESRI